MRPRYVIITPAKNEGKFIEKLIFSVIKQTIPPIKWIIVDDNSTDNTASIIGKYSDIYDWIHLVKRKKSVKRIPGGNVVESFYEGFKKINADYDFIVKLDADLELREDYFETVFNEFSNNSQLGIAGGECAYLDNGHIKVEKTPLHHVRGATKVYRKECFDQIGGLVPVMGWDGLDELKAMSLGWESRTIKGLYFYHLRPTGKGTGRLRFAFLNGKSSHYMGYDFVFFLFRCGKNIIQKPYFIFSIWMIIGYFYAVINKQKVHDDPELIRYIRKFQRTRLNIVSRISSKTSASF